MNHRKITDEKRSELNLLFKYGIPAVILEKVFDSSYMTIQKNITSDDKEISKDFPELPAEKKLFLFKLYAWIMTDEAECALSIGSNLTSKIAEGIYEYLKLKDWENILAGMKTLANLYRENKFHRTVAENYREFVNELFPPNKIKQGAKLLFKEMLSAMHKEKIPFPEPGDIGKPYLVLSKTSLDVFKQEGFVRYFDQDFISYLNFLMNNMEKKYALYLRAHFGISNIHFSKLSENLGHTDDTARGIKSKGINKLRGKLEKFVQNNLSFSINQSQANLANQAELARVQKELVSLKKTSEKETFSLKEKLSCLAKEFDGKLPLSSRASTIVVIYGNDTQIKELTTELETILNKDLIDLDLSVRLFNCLRHDRKIETIRELVQYEAEDLMRIRNFGSKCLAELQSIFEHEFQDKVWLGMAL